MRQISVRILFTYTNNPCDHQGGKLNIKINDNYNAYTEMQVMDEPKYFSNFNKVGQQVMVLTTNIVHNSV